MTANTLRILCVSVAAATTAVSTLARAAQASASSESVVDRAAATFRSIDTDRAGAVSFDEYRAIAYAAFDEADANDDLTLTLAEIGTDAGDRSTFMKLDDDGDKGISLAQYMRMQRLLFDFADLDLDGSLSSEEFLANVIGWRYGWLDANGDHRVNRDEYAQTLELAFEALDTDRSGTLSAAEYDVFAPLPAGSDRASFSMTGTTFIEKGLDRLPAGLR